MRYLKNGEGKCRCLNMDTVLLASELLTSVDCHKMQH
uniref:Uncharacterized protein n=1 Tax=Anguilla anguilla TaxID=7936 RepID=A0A0E9T2F4_ANGAN